MRIDPEELRRRYASMSDEELAEVDPDELTEIARSIFDEEYSRRQLNVEPADDFEPERGDGFVDDTDVEHPDWLEDAACACSFATRPDVPNASHAADAREVLAAAGIPSRIKAVKDMSVDPPLHEYCVMVPGALSLHAASVLDREIFNAEQEADWRAHLSAISDEDLQALDPAIFCAGLLDRVDRLRKAYRDEVARRMRE